jgi:hypothetical protein
MARPCCAFAGIGDSRLTVLDEECTRIGCGVAHEYWIAREARNAEPRFDSW